MHLFAKVSAKAEKATAAFSSKGRCFALDFWPVSSEARKDLVLEAGAPSRCSSPVVDSNGLRSGVSASSAAIFCKIRQDRPTKYLCTSYGWTASALGLCERQRAFHRHVIEQTLPCKSCFSSRRPGADGSGLRPAYPWYGPCGSLASPVSPARTSHERVQGT